MLLYIRWFVHEAASDAKGAPDNLLPNFCRRGIRSRTWQHLALRVIMR
jgi:hypothetical protein